MPLIHQGKSHRQVAEELGISIRLISKVRQRAGRNGLAALNAKSAITRAST
jgi:transposase